MRSNAFFSPAIIAGTPKDYDFASGRIYQDQHQNVVLTAQSSRAITTIDARSRNNKAFGSLSRQSSKHRKLQTDRLINPEPIKVKNTYRVNQINQYPYEQDSVEDVVQSIDNTEVEDLLRQNQLMNQAYQRGVSLYDVEQAQREPKATVMVGP